MSGEIRDFRKPGVGQRPGPVIMGQNEVKTALQRPNDEAEAVEAPQVEVTVHEEVVHEGDEKVRVRTEDGGLEIRVREGVTQQDWETIKREG